MEHVPFIDLGPWVRKVRGTDTSWEGAADFPFDRAVADLLDSNEFLGGGPTTQALEAKLSAKLGVSNVVTCANGTDALQLALRATGIGPGSRVAMPNVTFWATYEAIVNVGATPVLIDIDPDDRQMSFDEFEQAHDEKRFNAAILVHLYGWCSSRLTEFRSFCRERGVQLIEDGAQAFGVQVTDASPEPTVHSVFADADVATLSFHPAKVLGGIGDGGAVICKTARTATHVRMLANHGRLGRHEHAAVGWNSRLDAIQAAWLLRALDVVDEVIEARIALWNIYDGHLDNEPSCAALPAFEGNGYMTALLSETPAADIVTRLAENGIEARRIYPHTIAELGGGTVLGPLTHSRALVQHVVSLPLYYGMTDETVERCVRAYVEAVR